MLRRSSRPVRRDQDWAAIELDGERIDYLLKRSSARRTLSLRLNRDGVAQVNAPWAMPMAHIETFLRGHAAWLRQQMTRQRSVPEWADGMTLPFLGGGLRLECRPPGPGPLVRRAGGRLLCRAAETEIEAAVRAWYHAEAREFLARRLTDVCADIGWAVPAWRLSDARTRWGTLSAKGVISLNWRLIKATPEEIDYVIYHELAHFRRRDHSPAYWREVAALCPDYRALRARLHANSADYLAF